MRLHRLTHKKTARWDGGSTEEYFIYPEGASYSNRDFTIRLSRAVVERSGGSFTHLPGFKRFLIPLEKVMVLDVEGEEKRIPPHETFCFDGDQRILSRSTGADVNLMVSAEKEASFSSVPYANRLILRDEEIKAKILFFYHPERELLIQDGTYKLALPAGEWAVYIAEGPCELVCSAKGEANRLIWAKVIL